MVNDKSCNDGFLGIWDAWIEQHRIFRSIPSLKLRVLSKPSSSASLMPVDEVLILHMIVNRADPGHQVVLVPYSGIIVQGSGIVQDPRSGVHDGTGIHL
jgi:hypothetical protein